MTTRLPSSTITMANAEDFETYEGGDYKVFVGRSVLLAAVLMVMLLSQVVALCRPPCAVDFLSCLWVGFRKCLARYVPDRLLFLSRPCALCLVAFCLLILCSAQCAGGVSRGSARNPRCIALAAYTLSCCPHRRLSLVSLSLSVSLFLIQIALGLPRGMARFRSGRVSASVADFDRAIQLQPSLAPYMWQRGLSLYYGKHLSYE